MNTTEHLIADNVGILEQGLRMLRAVPDELYSKPEPCVNSSGIGAHVRHCVDYYERFLAGIEENLINYDLRERDDLLENSAPHAIAKIEATIARLRKLPKCNGEAISILQDSCVAPGETPPASRSSLNRELQFQMSHAVHHFALIAVILRLNDESPPEDFGVAPSTLRYWEEIGKCAP